MLQISKGYLNNQRRGRRNESWQEEKELFRAYTPHGI